MQIRHLIKCQINLINFWSLIFFLLSCSTNEYKIVGITNKSREEYFFGQNFKVQLSKVDNYTLDKVKSDLKNQLSISNSKNRIEEWKKISTLNIKNLDIFIFQLFPDTAVIPEFLDFEFECSNEKIIPDFKYYSMNLSAVGRSNFTNTYPVVIGLGPPGPYYPYYRTYTQDIDINIQNKHIYSYTFIIPLGRCMLKSGDRFKVITFEKNIIEFQKI